MIKLNIPEASIEYQVALHTLLQNYTTDQIKVTFYTLLSLISGYCQDAEVSLSMTGMGGVISIEELLQNSSGFKLATIKEFLRFHKDGYSGGDFQHIFLDTFLSVLTDKCLST